MTNADGRVFDGLTGLLKAMGLEVRPVDESQTPDFLKGNKAVIISFAIAVAFGLAALVIRMKLESRKDAVR